MPNKSRRALHLAAAVILHYTGTLGLLAFIRQRLTRRPTVYVLGFHRILTNEEQPLSHSLPGMVLRESTFTALLEYLKRKVQFVSLDCILGSGADKQKTDLPMCLVTFDDAWSDTYRRAAPVLHRLNIPAVLFVPTSAVDSQTGFWVEQLVRACKNKDTVSRISDRIGTSNDGHRTGIDLEEVIELLKRMPAKRRDGILADVTSSGNNNTRAGVDTMMTWDQVSTVAAHGIEVGSHTVTHPLLTFEDNATQAWELESSRNALRERLGADVRAFAYPNGDWDSKVRESVVRAGYSCAFTTKAGCFASGGDLYSIPRFLLHEGTVTGFRGRFSRAMTNLTLAGWG